MMTSTNDFSVSRPARILIVDDHPMMRVGLATQIGNEPDLTVYGEADDAAQWVSEHG